VIKEKRCCCSAIFAFAPFRPSNIYSSSRLPVANAIVVCHIDLQTGLMMTATVESAAMEPASMESVTVEPTTVEVAAAAVESVTVEPIT